MSTNPDAGCQARTALRGFVINSLDALGLTPHLERLVHWLARHLP